MGTDHQGQIEGILKELGKKVDELISEAKGAKNHVRDEAEEKIKDLKNRRGKLEDEFKAFKIKNEGKWEEIKTHLSRAAEEIKQAAEVAFRKKE